MPFKFKNKPIKIDFFTNDYCVYKYFSVYKTGSKKPKWISTAVDESPGGNINRCYGLNQLYKNTYTIPLWTQAKFNIQDQNWEAQCTSGSNCITSHVAEERGTYLNERFYSHVKFVTPWQIKCSENIDFLYFSSSMYDSVYIDRLHHLPGFRNHYYSPSLTAHFILSKNSNCEFLLEAGTPLQHFIPITSKKVILECHYDENEYKKLDSIKPLNFGGPSCFYKMKKAIDKTLN